MDGTFARARIARLERVLATTIRSLYWKGAVSDALKQDQEANAILHQTRGDPEEQPEENLEAPPVKFVRLAVRPQDLDGSGVFALDKNGNVWQYDFGQPDGLWMPLSDERAI